MGYIRQRKLKNGSMRYLAEIRLKGHPSLTATFDRKTDARAWIQKEEADIRSGRRQIWASLNQQIAVQEKYLLELKQRTNLISISAQDLIQDIKLRKKAFIKAVKHLQPAQSIVLDLRNNGGGDPHAVQFFCSLFIDENFPLNQIEERKGDTVETKLYSTLSRQELPLHERELETPIFIIIGPKTFSAAEEFCNNMKVLGRAVLIGEPSGGGANPGSMHSLGNDFEMFIPSGRAVNPIEGGNWEGVGVIPDHMVPAADALNQALHLVNQQ